MNLAIDIRQKVSEASVAVAVDATVAHPSPKLDVTETPLLERHSVSEKHERRRDMHEAEVQSEADDDNATVSTRTDDDIVNMAMTAILPSDDDDDDDDDDMDEQVVYPKRNISPQVV